MPCPNCEELHSGKPVFMINTNSVYTCRACGKILNPCDTNGNICSSEGIKHDTDKLRLDLMPADVMREVAKVYTFGAKKYGDRNWEKGIAYHRAYGAALRHMTAWWMRDDLDDETHIHHLAHAICELEFLLAFELRNMKHLDDRPTYKEVIPNEDTN